MRRPARPGADATPNSTRRRRRGGLLVLVATPAVAAAAMVAGLSLVVIRMRPGVAGRFVVHCHVLFHADHGMMAPVQVVR